MIKLLPLLLILIPILYIIIHNHFSVLRSAKKYNSDPRFRLDEPLNFTGRFVENTNDGTIVNADYSSLGEFHQNVNTGHIVDTKPH